MSVVQGMRTLVCQQADPVVEVDLFLVRHQGDLKIVPLCCIPAAVRITVSCCQETEREPLGALKCMAMKHSRLGLLVQDIELAHPFRGKGSPQSVSCLTSAHMCNPQP